MNSSMDESIIFPIVQSVGERPWGSEDLIGLVSNKFSVKRLNIKAGNKGGLQYHRLKDEVAIMISGKMLIRYDLGDNVLREKVVEAGAVVDGADVVAGAVVEGGGAAVVAGAWHAAAEVELQ